MVDVQWIKIVTDIFDNKKIKQIETMPDADSILVIWFKLLCLAGNINESGLMVITKDIAYNDEMLANEFRRPLNTVRLALKTFEQFEMIEVVNDVLCVSNWEKYQNIESLDKIREQSRLRVQKHRQNQKLLCNVTSNATVTESNAIEEELRKENKIKKEIYGTFKNVKLSLSEFQKLVEQYGQNKTDKAIEFLSSYREEKGYKNKNDYLSMLRWVFKAVEEKKGDSIDHSKKRAREEAESKELMELMQKEVDPHDIPNFADIAEKLKGKGLFHSVDDL